MKISVSQYTKSLFEVSESLNTTDEFIISLSSLNESSTGLGNFLLNPSESFEEKRKSLLSAGINEKLINFLLILTKEKNLGLLKNIILELSKLRNHKTNTEIVYVESANKLEQKELEDIKASLTNKFKKNIILKNKTNTNLIGGITLKIGDEFIDGSVRNKLENLKIELID